MIRPMFSFGAILTLRSRTIKRIGLVKAPEAARSGPPRDSRSPLFRHAAWPWFS